MERLPPPEPVSPTIEPLHWPAPVALVGEDCLDVAGVYYCVDSARFAEAPVPDADALRGWRCTGRGNARVCVERARLGGPFACRDEVCVQTHQRRPDDGEWVCIDQLGAVICQGASDAPAGVAASEPAAGWTCGRRQGHPAERVCVDLDPDLPPPSLRPWACRIKHEPVDRTVCKPRSTGSSALGSACEVPGSACEEGLVCIGGLCLPAMPITANCWLDADCGEHGKCALGTCIGA